ncbi:MYG1 family protein [Paracoccus litorisediminis]|uniref:MYG1 family protein n=1 Tax=Paracoccus litorisediminis TaxID=2006130 RepID=UPI00372FDE3C
MTAIPDVCELVTHSGSFHADEVLATAILLDLFPRADVLRSRDPDLTSPAPGRIVYDVGGVYYPEAMMFDHHQPGAPCRQDGTPFSAFGLIWRQFGRAWLARQLPSYAIEDAHSRIDVQIVRVIDLVDNGISSPGELSRYPQAMLSAAIADFAPSWLDTGDVSMNEAFDKAVAFAATVLRNRAASIGASIEADVHVREAAKKAGERPILVLERGMPWHGPILREPEFAHFKLVMHPRQGEEWIISTIPDAPGSYGTRLDLPATWAGLEGQALMQASGIEGAVFCHKKRFMAVASNGSVAGKMAIAALEIAAAEISISPET